MKPKNGNCATIEPANNRDMSGMATANEVSIRIHDDRLAALSLSQHCMRQAFFDNQPESKPMSYLCQQIRNNDRFASAGHTNQTAVLRSVSEPPFHSSSIPPFPVLTPFVSF